MVHSFLVKFWSSLQLKKGLEQLVYSAILGRRSFWYTLTDGHCIFDLLGMSSLEDGTLLQELNTMWESHHLACELLLYIPHCLRNCLANIEVLECPSTHETLPMGYHIPKSVHLSEKFNSVLCKDR